MTPRPLESVNPVRKLNWRRIFFVCLITLAAILPGTPLWAFDLRLTNPSPAAELENVIILDARPLETWKTSHIAGALSFSWETYTRTDKDGVKWRILPPEELAAALGALGIRHTDEVLVYGDADTSWGGEGWLVWMLAWLGHQGTVYYLDGGFQGWLAAGQPVSAAEGEKRPPAIYQANPQTQFIISSDQIEARKGRINLVDTRGYYKEWLLGHLPGAVHIGWEEFYQGKNRQVLPPEELKALLIKEGLDLNKPVVYYCTGGIRSGFTWLVHQLSGLPAAVNFEGGTEEWIQKRPLVR
jgi:thiosulfate/3-mercaptopyruvate sulfurtransferase